MRKSTLVKNGEEYNLFIASESGGGVFRVTVLVGPTTHLKNGQKFAPGEKKTMKFFLHQKTSLIEPSPALGKRLKFWESPIDF